jgi:CBS domain-containing protein
MKPRTKLVIDRRKKPPVVVHPADDAPQGNSVGNVMEREFVFCHQDDDCATALRLMGEHGVEFLPVVDGNMRIIGTLSASSSLAADGVSSFRSS